MIWKLKWFRQTHDGDNLKIMACLKQANICHCCVMFVFLQFNDSCLWIIMCNYCPNHQYIFATFDLRITHSTKIAAEDQLTANLIIAKARGLSNVCPNARSQVPVIVMWKKISIPYHDIDRGHNYRFLAWTSYLERCLHQSPSLCLHRPQKSRNHQQKPLMTNSGTWVL